MATFFEYYELLKSILVPHFFYLFSLSIIKYFVKNEIAIRVLESFFLDMLLGSFVVYCNLLCSYSFYYCIKINCWEGGRRKIVIKKFRRPPKKNYLCISLIKNLKRYERPLYSGFTQHL